MFSRELILSQFTKFRIHQYVYSLIFISISNFPQSQGFGVDLYCRPPGQVPVVLNSLISNVSEIYPMISRLMCRSWINVTQSREGSLWGWERKLFESHCERESLKDLALFRAPSVWKATAAENLWGKEESCRADWQSRYRQPVQGVGQHWHRGQHSSTIEPRNTRQKGAQNFKSYVFSNTWFLRPLQIFVVASEDLPR